MSEQQFKRISHTSIMQASDEYLVLDQATGCCHVLNATAGRLLSMMDEFVSLPVLTEDVHRRYPAVERQELGEQIAAFVPELVTAGVLEARVSQAGGGSAFPRRKDGAREATPWQKPAILNSYTEAQLSRELQDAHVQVGGYDGTSVAGIRG